MSHCLTFLVVWQGFHDMNEKVLLQTHLLSTFLQALLQPFEQALKEGLLGFSFSNLPDSFARTLPNERESRVR